MSVKLIEVSPINAKAKDDIAVVFKIYSNGSGTYDVPWKINADNNSVADGSVKVTAGANIKITEKIDFYDSGEYKIDVKLFPPIDRIASDNQSESIDILLSDWPGWMCQLKKPTIAALNDWRQQVNLQNVLITGSLATLGRITGTKFRQYLHLRTLTIEPSDRTLSNVYSVMENKLANVIDTNLFGANFLVHEPAWYPLFIAVPAVIAPPTDNIPSPLSNLVSTTGISQAQLSSSIFSSGLNAEKDWPGAQNSIQNFTGWYVDVINLFIQTAFVSKVVGQGPTAAVLTGTGAIIPGPVIAGSGSGRFLAKTSNFVDPRTWLCP